MTPPSTADRTAAPGRSRSVLVVGTLALTGTVVSLQQTLVLPLVPDFPRLLDTTADNASWLVTATLLFGAVSIPTVSRLADMFGKKRMMMVALAVMVLGSALGALSPSLPFVITARAMQGVGLSLVPVGIAIMRDELPRERVPLGVALMSATLAIGAGAGLPLSGLIVAHLDWHAIFWVTGAVGTILLAVVWRVLAESPGQTRGSFDFRGALVVSAALTAVMLALSKGAHWGWTSRITLALAAVGVALLVAWVSLELRVRNPLVDVRVAARPAVLLVNIASLLSGFAMFSNMLVTTEQLQMPATSGYGLGLDVLHTGLWMAPTALVFGAMAPLAARQIHLFGPLVTLLTGFLVMAGSYVARVYLSHGLGHIVMGSMLVSVGVSMTYAAMPTLIMRAVPATETASANGLNTLLRYFGTSASSAAMAVVTTMSVVRVGSDVFPSFDALLTVFWVAAGVSLLAGLVVLPLIGMPKALDEALESPGHIRDAVVHGRVISTSGRPVRHAVVAVLTQWGDQVDWSQVDSAGDFSVAIPGPGRYLVVTAAEGWAPTSRLGNLEAEAEMDTIVLAERLTLSGTVTDVRGGVEGAVVALTRQSGEAVGTATTGPEGCYEMHLPGNGRYVLTAVTRCSTVARAATVWGATRVVDPQLPGEEALS